MVPISLATSLGFCLRMIFTATCCHFQVPVPCQTLTKYVQTEINRPIGTLAKNRRTDVQISKLQDGDRALVGSNTPLEGEEFLVCESADFKKYPQGWSLTQSQKPMVLSEARKAMLFFVGPGALAPFSARLAHKQGTARCALHLFWSKCSTSLAQRTLFHLKDP